MSLPLQLETIKTKPKDFDNDIDRVNHIVGTVMNLIPSSAFVCIEDYYVPFSSAQIGAAVKLVSLGTIMRFALYHHKIPFVVISPSQLKKFATGKGNCQKNMVLREVFKRWGVDCVDDNQADALTLAKMAHHISAGKWSSAVGLDMSYTGTGFCYIEGNLDTSIEVPKFQVDLLAKVRKENRSYGCTL